MTVPLCQHTSTSVHKQHNNNTLQYTPLAGNEVGTLYELRRVMLHASTCARKIGVGVVFAVVDTDVTDDDDSVTVGDDAAFVIVVAVVAFVIVEAALTLTICVDTSFARTDDVLSFVCVVRVDSRHAYTLCASRDVNVVVDVGVVRVASLCVIAS
jgi:hypothetical protein